MIDVAKIQITFFFLLFLGISLLTYFLFLPFLSIFFLAGISAVLLYPWYRKILVRFKRREGLAAGITVILAAILFTAPLLFIGARILQESQGIYTTIEQNNVAILENIVRSIEEPVRKFSPDFTLQVDQLAGKIFGFITENLGPFVSGAANILFGFFLTLLALYFFLKDGHKIVPAILSLSPLPDEYDNEILKKIHLTIQSVVKGTLLIALIQGSLVGLGFIIFGIPNATLWGSIAAITALVPGIGTAVINIPGVVFLWLSGHTGAAVGLLIWGSFIVGLVDNFLAPYFYSRGIAIHPVFVLFAVLGGLSLFGPLGFLFGPIILSIFLALVHIYKLFILGGEEQLEKDDPKK